ncbi:MAG: GNAT family N-acetyltransferase [Kordiimonadales bacterium]|nr:MAG: GNAT family N-acetyltransferase [Kordiimonadales bacterium]
MLDLTKWTPCDRPGGTVQLGHYARLEPFDWDAHGTGLFAAICSASDDALWDYMPVGPFSGLEAFKATLSTAIERLNWATMIIRSVDTNEILGMASYMRLREEQGSAEVGFICFAKKLQRSRTATEAMYLMAKYLFEDLGYRRYEWKCHTENAGSKRAALRFGFAYEGIFRNESVQKGKNRDTAWYAMTHEDWPKLAAAYGAWLLPENFDDQGQQITQLAAREVAFSL